MTWKGIDPLSAAGRGRTITEMKTFIDNLPRTTWASGMVLHNTSAPTLSQWTPANRAQRILNLQSYFRDERKWNSAPHAFVDYDFVWNFTPYTEKGTHSPSWNGTKLGIEMIGDFIPGGDDASQGKGLAVVRNTAALFALIHSHYGWDPGTIRLHKEDPLTTHDCPGGQIIKKEFIAMVQEYMGEGGEHKPVDDSPITDIPAQVPAFKLGTVVVDPKDSLTLREGSSASSDSKGAMPNGTVLKIMDTAMNGKTKWLRVETPAGYEGWVNADYVRLQSP